MQQSVVNWVLLITLVIVYAEPRYGGYPTGYPFGYPTGYPTGYPAHYPIGYPTSYRTPFIPGFRQYPPAPQKPQSFSPNGRIFFLESTVYVTTTSLSLVTCTYSTAALSSCRKRRNILLGDDEEFIAPSEVVSITATPEARLEDVRDEHQEGFTNTKDDIQPSHFLTLADGGRLFFNIQYTTSTSTVSSTTTVSSLVTCAPATGTIYGRC